MQLFEEYTYMMKVMNDLVSINAHAKINLTLDVLNPEPNGYHRIMSVMQTIALHEKSPSQTVSQNPAFYFTKKT